MKSKVAQSPSPRPTQKDIAAGLNVSLITVHRALKKSGYVSQEMQQRIVDYARKIGYQPDRAAQSLVRKSVRTLAIFSTEKPEFYWNEVEKGVQTAFAQIADFGFQVRYLRIPTSNTVSYLKALKKQKESGLDGAIIVNNLEYDMESIFHYLDEWKIPYGTLNIDAPTSGRKAFIGVDHRREGQLAAGFLAGFCRSGESLLMISSEPLRNTAIEGADIALERWTGFVGVAENRKIPSEKIIFQENSLSGRALENRGGIYITALNPELIKSIRSQTSIPIIVGTSSPEYKELLKKGIIQAIICQNPVLQGYYAVKTMELMLESNNTEPVIIKLVHSLLLRENMDLTENNLLLMN